MKYEDEKILDQLREIEKLKRPNNILAGPIIIDGQSYVFEERSFFKDRLKCMSPLSLLQCPSICKRLNILMSNVQK